MPVALNTVEDLDHHEWARALCRAFFRAFAIELRVTVAEDVAVPVSPEVRRIFVVRQVSPATLPLVRAVRRGRLSMLVAARVRRWPLLGWLSEALQSIHVRPGSDADWLIEQVRARLNQGCDVVLPIARSGLAIPPGGLVPREPAAIVEGCHAPWVPVAVSGLASLWPPHELAPAIGTVHVLVGATQPPLATCIDDGNTSLRARIEAAMEAADLQLAGIIAEEMAPKTPKEPFFV